MKKDKVSIIVPCYNIDKYIRKCVDSLLMQTYDNIEIILVDDQSTDLTGEILDGYALIDNRVIVFHKKNGGLSDARNYGLERCSGKYVCFVDGDDYVSTRYIEKMYISMIKTDSDIVACNYYYEDEKGRQWLSHEIIDTVYDNIGALVDFMSYEQNLGVVAWNKMYKKTLFIDNDIRYPYGKFHEDNYTTYKVFYHSKRISLISDSLYYYIQRSDSIMGKKFNKKRFDIIGSLDGLKNLIEDNDLSLRENYDAFEAMVRITLLNNMIRSRYINKDTKQFMDELLNDRQKYLKNSLLKKKFRTMLLLMRHRKIYKQIVRMT